MSTGTAPPRATVSEAVERGGQALYAKAMPRGATPWNRHSHAFQGIYLERAGTVMAAGLDVEEMAAVLRDHVVVRVPVIAGRNGWACTCGNSYAGDTRQSPTRPDALHAAHQAAALRARLLGGAA